MHAKLVPYLIDGKEKLPVNLLESFVMDKRWIYGDSWRSWNFFDYFAKAAYSINMFTWHWMFLLRINDAFGCELTIFVDFFMLMNWCMDHWVLNNDLLWIKLWTIKSYSSKPYTWISYPINGVKLIKMCPKVEFD